MSDYPLDFTKAYDDLAISADFKAELSDFTVDEQLGFEPSGSGEHVFLWVEKIDLTTERLIGDIARAFAVSRKQVGLSGLKDKQGITRQWLSVPVPIKQELPLLEDLQSANWKVLKMTRHDRKLKRGVHKANAFTVTLKNIDYGNSSQQALEQRLQLIAEQGIPNYFGPQRFGFNGQNMQKALALFSGELKLKPAQRSIYYSAVRSYLFNRYLSERIVQHNWQQAISGDVLMLEGTQSIFRQEQDASNGNDEMTEINARIKALDCHPTGILFGDGRGFDLAADELWQQVVVPFEAFQQGLLKAGLNSAFRALRLLPKALNWRFDGDSCELSFTLASGAYATALLHECVNIRGDLW